MATNKEELIRYFEYAKEAVNEKNAREFRGKVIEERINLSLRSKMYNKTN